MQSVQPGTAKNVLAIDDHPFFHHWLSGFVFSVFPDAQLHCETSLDAALRWAHSAARLDLVLLDLGLPNCSGLEAFYRVRREMPDSRVVIVSDAQDPARILDALRGGAAGYIPKSTSVPIIRLALQIVDAGGTFIPPQALSGVGEAPGGAQPMPEGVFSERQLEVLRRLIKGMRNREIARELNISENTVKQHVYTVYQTLGVSNRGDAKFAAARRGLSIY
jgi:DNA-binding NarL/FixJ family response regulator